MIFSLFCAQLLNGFQLGVLLFLLSAGLTLVLGIMQFINLAHGSLFMMGAYFAVAAYDSTNSFILAAYFFSPSWQNDSWAEAAGKYATDKGYKRMILVASNCQAGKDGINGFKKLYKGTIVDEIYPGMTQPDFSAEMSQISSQNPDAVFAFVPAGGVNFIRQYQQAGLLTKLPLLTVGMVDGTTLPTLKETALGIQATHFWAPDTDTPVSKQFVEAFERKYGRIPSNLAALGYDSALLLDAAIERVKGNVTDRNAFMAALKQGVANSVRGALRFNNNNFPINNWYAFEAAKDAKGRVSLKTIATPLTDYQDSYHDKCPMK